MTDNDPEMTVLSIDGTVAYDHVYPASVLFFSDAAEKRHMAPETSKDLKKSYGGRAHKQPHTLRQPCEAKVPFHGHQAAPAG